MKSGFGKNLAQLGFFTYLSAVFRFLTTLVLARVLMPEEFGLIAMIQVFSGVILVLRDAGFSVAVIRGNVGLNMKELQTASLASGLFFFILMFALSFYLPTFYELDQIRTPAQVLALVFIFSSLTTVPQALLRKELDFRRLGRYRLISELVSSSICVLVAFIGFSYWSLVIRELSYFLWMFLLFRKSVSSIGFKSLFGIRKRMNAFAKIVSQYGSIQMLEYGARNIDNLLIGKLLGDRDLGLYSRAYSLIYISHTFLLGIVNKVMFPTLESEGKTAMPKFLLTFVGLSLLTGIANLILMLFPDQIVLILWGRNWLDLVSFIPYVGITIFIQIPFGMFANIFMVNKKDSVLLKLTTLKFLIIAISISIGVFNGIESLLQWYNGGFILYGIILLLVLRKSAEIRKADFFTYWISIIATAAFLSHQLFSLSILFLISVWLLHSLYSGIVLWLSYRKIKLVQ